ncbi:hypothetical protein DRQ19_01655 [bacterium]|nr:MAG: hypothetical protein DRQ19_01655 [bacterium]
MQVLVIGLGSFGFKVAQTLAERDVPFLGIDKDQNRVDEFIEISPSAMRLDATNLEALEQLGLKQFDTAIISLGNSIEPSVLVTLFLREAGVKKIIVKGISREHGEVLKKVGATDVVFPEEEGAVRLANSLTIPNLLDHIPLTEGYSVVEMTLPESFEGKSLLELEIRKKYNIEIIAIKREGEVIVIPSALEVMNKGDTLVVIGRNDDIDDLRGR